jgi:hypothetical protein
MSEAVVYRVLLDSAWSLDDLYDFPHALNQAYLFAYCFDTDLPTHDAERIDRALKSYPWAGGFSVVNMYRVLHGQVPAEYRPRIKAIQYASPGFLDLFVHGDAIRSVAESVSLIYGGTPTVVKAVAGTTLAGGAAVSAMKSLEKVARSVETIVATYGRIQKVLTGINLRRKESKIKHLKLDAAEAAALHKLCEQFSKLIGFKGFAGLTRRTDSPEVAAKLLSAHYRRLKEIADFAEDRRATLPVEDKSN